MTNSFDLQPTLIGPSISLYPLTESDYGDLFAAACDPLIWEQHPEPTRFQENVFRKYFNGAIESKGAFVVRDNETQKIIGSSRYYDFRPEQNQVIVGYTFLQRQYWGGSANREMKTLMIEHAFQFVDSVLFEVGETNFRSRKAMEKLGGRLVNELVLDGNPHVVYEIRHNEMNRI